MALKVTLLSASGRSYELTGSERTSEVVSPVESLVGLSGVSARSDMAVPGRSGVVLGRRRFGPIQQEVEFFLNTREDRFGLDEVYAKFRQGWSDRVPSVLTVQADHPLGAFHLDLLLDKPLGGVPVDMRKRSTALVRAALVAQAGLFRSDPFSGSGVVTVRNLGDEVIYPRIVYSGAGGQVVCPSGASFVLLPSAVPAVVDLDPRRLRLSGAFPEGVAPGGVGVWRLPTDASLAWEVLVADPWA